MIDTGIKVEFRIEGEDGKLIKTEKSVEYKNYLKFVPFVYGEFKVIVIFYAENNYLVEFKVITQMFSESFRLKKLAEYRLRRFVNGFFPPEYIVIKEHGWKIASKSLQSKQIEHKHELHVADVP